MKAIERYAEKFGSQKETPKAYTKDGIPNICPFLFFGTNYLSCMGGTEGFGNVEVDCRFCWNRDEREF